MISQETARKIYNCYEQIKHSNALIETVKKDFNKDSGKLISSDNTRERTLELGIPSGLGSTRVVRVDVDLAVDAILRNIELQEKELLTLKAIAKAELA